MLAAQPLKFFCVIMIFLEKMQNLGEKDKILKIFEIFWIFWIFLEILGRIFEANFGETSVIICKLRKKLGIFMTPPKLKKKTLLAALWFAWHSSVNFLNFLHAAFTGPDPKSLRTQSSCQYHFTLLGSARVKAEQKKLMKLTPGVARPPRQVERWCYKMASNFFAIALFEAKLTKSIKFKKSDTLFEFLLGFV